MGNPAEGIAELGKAAALNPKADFVQWKLAVAWRIAEELRRGHQMACPRRVTKMFAGLMSR